jgi:hypothetical protein
MWWFALIVLLACIPLGGWMVALIIDDYHERRWPFAAIPTGYNSYDLKKLRDQSITPKGHPTPQPTPVVYIIPEHLHNEWVERRLGPKPDCNHPTIETPDYIRFPTPTIPDPRHDPQTCPERKWQQKATTMITQLDTDWPHR